jgi:hypothetical protein
MGMMEINDPYVTDLCYEVMRFGIEYGGWPHCLGLKAAVLRRLDDANGSRTNIEAKNQRTENSHRYICVIHSTALETSGAYRAPILSVKAALPANVAWKPCADHHLPISP